MSDENPASDISGILTGTGRAAYSERLRRHLVGVADALNNAAAVEKAAIKKSGRRWLRGLDVMRAAYRITRPTRHAADLCEEAARAVATGQAIYVEEFAPMSAQVKDDFQPHK